MKSRSLAIAGIASMFSITSFESARAASVIGQFPHAAVPAPLTVSLFGIGLIVFAIAKSRQNENRNTEATDVAAMISR
jgi:hypothetical protein